MTNPIVDKVTEFLWSIAIKKGVSFAVKAIIAILTGVKVAPILASLGVTIDTKIMATELAVLLGSLLTIAQNWLKIKFGLKFL